MTTAPSQSVPTDRFGEIAHSYATVRLLEECTLACEMLAEELGTDPGDVAMQNLLSECIASCGALLGATVRESPYAPRYALLCGEICAATADACTRRIAAAPAAPGGPAVPGGRCGVRGSLESDAFQTQTHSLCPDVLPRMPLLGAAASASGWNGRGHFVRAFPFANIILGGIF